MKNTITQLHSYLKAKLNSFWIQSCKPKIIGVAREMEHWLGIRFVKVELTNLNHYSTNLIEQIGKNYQSHKKSNFVCVSSSANAYNLTHNEVAANIEKCQKLSEARWNDELIEYICNH